MKMQSNVNVGKTIQGTTDKYWRMADAIATIVRNNGNMVETNPISEISSVKFRRYYKASVQFDKAARALGLSFDYYDTLVDIDGAFDWLKKAKDQKWSVDELRHQLKNAGMKVAPVAQLKTLLNTVDKMRFKTYEKQQSVYIAKDINTGEPVVRIGGTVLTRPNVYAIHRKMGSYK